MSFHVKKTVSAEQLDGIVSLPLSFRNKRLSITVEVEELPQRDPEKFKEAVEYFRTHPIKSDVTLEEGREERLKRYETTD